MAEFSRGDRVRHPAMEGWGVGMVLDDSDGETVRVFFAGTGEKTLSLRHVRPVIVSGDVAESSVLDNLKLTGGKVSVGYRSLPASIEYFLAEFPGGFHGERYARHERLHKEAIRDEVQAQLSCEKLRAMLDAGEHRRICDLAIRLTGVQSNAMIFKSEKISLREGLKDPGASVRFAQSLYDLLHDEGDLSGRFDAFADVLETAGSAKWTVATYFLFFMHPDSQMFVKPTITRNAAEVCAFEIGYRPEVNAATYALVLRFSSYLRENIALLEPRDMIDVQSFMWCIAPGTYGADDV